MKRIVVLFVSVMLTNVALSQTNKSELLVNRIWILKSDEMSGVGMHTSLENKTELQFFNDGTWKSTQPIREVTQGTWKLEKERTLVMLIADEEVRYLILQLTDNELQFRLKRMRQRIHINGYRLNG